MAYLPGCGVPGSEFTYDTSCVYRLSLFGLFCHDFELQAHVNFETICSFFVFARQILRPSREAHTHIFFWKTAEASLERHTTAKRDSRKGRVATKKGAFCSCVRGLRALHASNWLRL